MSTTPSTLGKYQIIREIARSNDIVYEAYDPLMNRRVAVKELSVPSGSTSQQREERVKRFQREVKAAGSLAHPNIVTIYEVGEDAGHYFMAMEYLDGHTLRNELDTHGFLPPDRSIEIAIEVLEALEFAHGKGVIHRDIKPENIQLLEDGRIKLTDFGIARLTFEPNLTIDGQVFGTPSYMSPEQVVGKEIDARSDLFSLGSVLYEMVAGQKAFQGDSVVSTTYAIMNSNPSQPTQANYALWQVIQKAIDKSPALRYPHARDMVSDLSNVLKQAQSGNMVLDPIPGPPPVLLSNPYGQPFLAPYQVPQAAPPSYPYNPYQAAQTPYSHQPYIPPIGGASLPMVPVYSPPPPRRPLVKPESKRFMGRLFLTFLVMGTLFALIIVAINSLAAAADRINKESQDRAISDKVATAPVPKSPDQRISEQEKMLKQLQSDSARQEALARLALDYERQGKHLEQEGNFIEAEAAYLEAIKRDPRNPAFHADLGGLYAQSAISDPNDDNRVALWTQAGEQWRNSSDLETNENDRAKAAETAAEAYRNGAQILVDSRRNQEAADLLYEARKVAPEGSQASAAIQQMLSNIGR